MQKYLIAFVTAALTASTTAFADTPLADFVAARHFRARSNPGSANLVGDIYPDKKQVGVGRVFKLSECFVDVVPDPPEALENATEIVSYGTSDISLFLNLAKKSAPEGADVGSLNAAFAANHVRYVTLKATDLVHVALSTGVIGQKGKSSQCAGALFDRRNYLVSDAIGATTLSYEFLDDNKKSLSGDLSAIASILFKFGFSKSQTTMGSASFEHPVFIGFGVVQWDGSQFKLQ
jgi:hypothetical protein